MAGANEAEYSNMISALRRGIADNPSLCGPYWQSRDRMFKCDGLLLYDDRLVIPRALRKRVLDVLHAAHQGISSMTHRASVYWPGISADIANRRAMCPTCEKAQPVPPTGAEPAIGPAHYSLRVYRSTTAT